MVLVLRGGGCGGTSVWATGVVLWRAGKVGERWEEDGGRVCGGDGGVEVVLAESGGNLVRSEDSSGRAVVHVHAGGCDWEEARRSRRKRSSGERHGWRAKDGGGRSGAEVK